MSRSRSDVRILNGFTNVFLLRSSEGAVLVDTGLARNAPRIAGFLEQCGLSFRDLSLLVATHSHNDHVAALAEVKERSGASVLAHAAETENLARGEPSYPKGTNPLTSASSWFSEIFLRKLYRYPPVRTDVAISEDTDLSGFGVDATVLCTPGHSVGSLSVMVNRESAIVGDSLFNVLRLVEYPPWADDPSALIKSWQKLLATGCSVFYPAHGLPVSAQRLSRLLRRKVAR